MKKLTIILGVVILIQLIININMKRVHTDHLLGKDEIIHIEQERWANQYQYSVELEEKLIEVMDKKDCSTYEDQIDGLLVEIMYLGAELDSVHLEQMKLVEFVDEMWGQYRN